MALGYLAVTVLTSDSAGTNILALQDAKSTAANMIDIFFIKNLLQVAKYAFIAARRNSITDRHARTYSAKIYPGPEKDDHNANTHEYDVNSAAMFFIIF